MAGGRVSSSRPALGSEVGGCDLIGYTHLNPSLFNRFSFFVCLDSENMNVYAFNLASKRVRERNTYRLFIGIDLEVPIFVEFPGLSFWVLLEPIFRTHIPMMISRIETICSVRDLLGQNSIPWLHRRCIVIPLPSKLLQVRMWLSFGGHGDIRGRSGSGIRGGERECRGSNSWACHLRWQMGKRWWRRYRGEAQA